LYNESVIKRDGVLLHSELNKIWDTKEYPLNIHCKLLELMERFELIYELRCEESHLVPELLPKIEPDDFSWDEEDNLCFFIVMTIFCLLA
jgi:internalin A